MGIGLYIHVPFCATKCPYCDFYSLTGTDESLRDRYCDAVIRSLEAWASRRADTVETLYFGGGTPSLLSGTQIARLIDGVRKFFPLATDAEITAEANPGDGLIPFFEAFKASGGNRVSLGMQAENDAALASLGRRHTAKQTEDAVRAAHNAGIDNVSLDLMLATPHQTAQNVKDAVARCAALGASHVSAYLLKREPDTPFGKNPPPLPSDDEAADLYLTAVSALERAGYLQYEISNFAKHGKQSRHNLKYWNSEPYLGIGPAAHSFLDGKRFYYPRSLSSFLDGDPPLAEQENETLIAENSPAEYAMLRLRLTEGLTEQDFRSRFGTPLPAAWRKAAAAFPPSLVKADDTGIRFTPQGFLVSDALISRILL